MKQCKHMNCAVKEPAVVTQSWSVEKGKMAEEGYFSEPDILDELYVKCYDCGLDKTYSKKRLPKWLKKHWDWIREGKWD